jgi:tRNA threonylcarbamoyladenosine biosynthesis protein TsaB
LSKFDFYLKMSCLLAIETSTKICSLVLSVDGKPVFERIHTDGASHAAQLGVFASEAVKQARKDHLKIEAVAVSSGPGSYTGLRIGVSEAKGLCYGFDIPLIAIPTLKILASQALHRAPCTVPPLYCPMIDARRMEVYAALYDAGLNEIRPVQADIIDENSYREQLAEHTVVFFGDGSDKCRTVIQSPHAVFIEGIYPEAKAMIPLAEKALAEKQFVDVAYFEPFYLKEFQATVAKNKVLF